MILLSAKYIHYSDIILAVYFIIPGWALHIFKCPIRKVVFYHIVIIISAVCLLKEHLAYYPPKCHKQIHGF